MKKIGREVLFIPRKDGNPRNGEGAFIRLNDGAILFGYTEYIGTSGDDHANARLSCFTSRDEGETWGEWRIMLDTPKDCKNIMSLSFLRMGNGDIGAFYILKELDGTDKIMLIRSCDEGLSWSEPTNCMACLERNDYFVLNNDRVIRLKSGRILFAVSRHTVHEIPGRFMPGVVCFFISDDDGRSWYKTETELTPHYKTDPVGYQEPGLYVLPDGKIRCYIRTGLGCQCRAFSDDDGITWSEVELDRFFSSPTAPMLIKDVGPYTVSIFNPIPSYTTRPSSEPWGRTPFVCAVSDDRGVTFRHDRLFYVEDDLTHGYCYPAVIEGDGYFLCAYYVSDDEGRCLIHQRIKKVAFEEIM